MESNVKLYLISAANIESKTVKMKSSFCAKHWDRRNRAELSL